jgi:hypothetical protein
MFLFKLYVFIYVILYAADTELNAKLEKKNHNDDILFDLINIHHN